MFPRRHRVQPDLGRGGRPGSPGLNFRARSTCSSRPTTRSALHKARVLSLTPRAAFGALAKALRAHGQNTLLGSDGEGRLRREDDPPPRHPPFPYRHGPAPSGKPGPVSMSLSSTLALSSWMGRCCGHLGRFEGVSAKQQVSSPVSLGFARPAMTRDTTKRVGAPLPPFNTLALWRTAWTA